MTRPLGALALVLATIVSVISLPAKAEQESAERASGQMPDLRDHRAGAERKIAFFSLLIPLIEQANGVIEQDRQWLQAVRHQTHWTPAERQRLASLCDQYGMRCSDENEVSWPRLLRRVDSVPIQLVLIQAVEESGWGTSRFAREGNNLFGIRCFSSSCGMAQHGSRRRYQDFASLDAAVRAYLLNLNTHRGYEQFREKRAELRRLKRNVTALALIPELNNYSVRGDAYLAALQSLLATNASLIEELRSSSDEALS